MLLERRLLLLLERRRLRAARGHEPSKAGRRRDKRLQQRLVRRHRRVRPAGPARADANAAAARERWGPLTCRTWLLRTLSELDDEGYISIKPAATVEEVEEEALSLAGSNAADMQGGKQLGAKDKVYRSVYSVA